jgi:hypothetical protein
VAVHRKEVYDAIKNENQQAAAFRGELGSLRPRGSTRGAKANPGGTVLPAAAKLAATQTTRRETA